MAEAPLVSKEIGNDSNTLQQLFHAVIETVRQPLLVLDARLTVRLANAPFLRCFDVSAEETLDRPLASLGNGQWDIPELRRLLDEILPSDGHVEDYRVDHDFESIGRRVMLLNARRLERDGDDLILLAIADVTEAEQGRRELEAQNEFNEKLIDSVREGLLVLNDDLTVQRANQSFYDAFGTSPEQTVGRRVYELGNSQWDIPNLHDLLNSILPEETSFDDFEIDHEFPGLGRRIMMLNARRLDHRDLILLAIRDVTEIRKAEVVQQTLAGELRHRVKNILSNVDAIHRATYRRSRDLDSYSTAFGARLRSLARAVDLLVERPRQRIDLARLIRGELDAIAGGDAERYSIEGPDVAIQARMVQTLAMVFHELATNAAKHGALAVEGGRIAVDWRVEDRDDGQVLVVGWRESGAVIPAVPTRKGYGMQIIERSVPYVTGGKADLVFHPDGLECRFDIPLAEKEGGGRG